MDVLGFISGQRKLEHVLELAAELHEAGLAIRHLLFQASPQLDDAALYISGKGIAFALRGCCARP